MSLKRIEFINIFGANNIMKENKLSKSKIINIILMSVLLINLVITGYLLSSNIKTKIENSKLESKYTLYIGTNDKDTYKPVYEYETCITKVNEIVTKYTFGSTIFEATGYWTDDNNNITEEKTIGCILESISLEDVYKICDEVLVALNQNSILIETGNVNTTFYYGSK